MTRNSSKQDTYGDRELIRQFKARIAKKVKCPRCGAVFYRKALMKKLKETLDDTNIKTQISNPADITFLACPRCSEGVDFSRCNAYGL